MRLPIMATISQQVFFEGRVQGVGFRYSVKEVANGFDVVGWIKNLPDGRVEMQVQGQPGEVNAFVEEILQSHLRPFVVRHIRREIAFPESLKGFEIR
jgi:acylphosphatase